MNKPYRNRSLDYVFTY